MKRVLKSAVLFALVLAVAAPLAAEDAAKKEKKEGKKASPAAAILKKLEGAELTADQKAQIEKIANEYAPKLGELRKQAGEALKKVKDQGLEGKALKEALAKVEGAAELKELNGKMNEAVLAVLTPDQREKAGLNKKPGEKKPAAKKPGEKKPEAKKGEKKPEAKENAEKKPEEKKAEN